MNEKPKYKIAIITAFIGDGGQTGELSLTEGARRELAEFGVDIYFINDSRKEELIRYEQPTLSREEVVQETWRDRWVRWYYRTIKYPQKVVPSAETNRNRLLAKLPKMCFYHFVPETYDYYIWLDSKFAIEEHWLKYILWLIETNKEADILISKHSDRRSVREECEIIGEWSAHKGNTKYCVADLAYQVWKYLHTPGFVDSKLYECGLIIYPAKMLKKREFLEEWYAHNFYFSIQDQLSFPFLVQKHGLKVHQIVQNVMNMPFSSHEYYGR